MNEKGRLILPHVFWDGFPRQEVAYNFLREQGLTFSDGNYEWVLSQLLERYGFERLGLLVTEHIKHRLHPDDLIELSLQYWADELPDLETFRKVDPTGYRSWVEIEFASAKDWSRFVRFYFEYLVDRPPYGRKRAI